MEAGNAERSGCDCVDTMITYTVVRNCCTSGNCIKCQRVTKLGTPLRIVQQTGLTLEQAKRVQMGWGSYGATIMEAGLVK